MTKKLMTLLLVMLAWVMPLDAFAANMTGDVNNDSEVNIADVNAVINIILSGGSDLSGDVNGDGEVNIADINAVIAIILGGGDTPTPEGHEWVDLGLPSGTLWATCNIGATTPEGYGDYFAWGETEPKQVYDWQTYKWGYYFQGGMSKYVTNSEYGMIDYKTELELEDDAASANWGPSWCTPSSEQQSELYSECSWEWTSMNDVNGYMVTGPKGNKLFLPAAGYYEGNSNDNEGLRGEYWSRMLRVNNAIHSYTLHLYGGYYGSVSMFEETREKGLSVRAVRVSPDDLHIEQQSLDLGVVPIGETCTGQLTFVNCTMKSMTLTLTADAPFSFNHEEDNASSITVVVPGNSRDTVTVMFTATTPGEFNGNVTIQNSAPDGSQRAIPVHADAFTDDFPPHEYVDLGLPSGTLWATMNIGANSPEEYGDYFAWGEITPKEVYSWGTYKWCDGTPSSMTKYCIDSYYGLIDHKFELEPADDAAYMNWGPSWRMPTREQQIELRQYCTWQISSINDITGHLVTGPNGNTLFFPRAGMYDGSTPNYYAGQFSFYWSRTLTCFSNSAYSTYSMGETSRYRSNGLSVRAVRVSDD